MLFVAPQAVNDGSLVGSMRGTSVQQQLYSAVSAASSWLDAAENQLLSGPVLLSENTETQLTNFEVVETLPLYYRSSITFTPLILTRDIVSLDLVFKQAAEDDDPGGEPLQRPHGWRSRSTVWQGRASPDGRYAGGFAREDGTAGVHLSAIL